MQTIKKLNPNSRTETRLTEINDIESATSLLYWDQATYMPPGGAAARGRQMATLRHCTKKFIAPPSSCWKITPLQTAYRMNPMKPASSASLARL